jgi:hypothetical protein
MAEPFITIYGDRFTQADIDRLEPGPLRDAAQALLNEVAAEQAQQQAFEEAVRAAKAAAASQAEVERIEARAREAKARADAQIAVLQARAEAAERAERARIERMREQERIAAQRQARQRAQRPRHEAVPVTSSGITATTILPESPEVRFLDAGITGAVSAVSVVWTATRPTPLSRVGWAAFWSGLGALMAVEGRGELRYAGFGLVGSNLSFLALDLFHLLRS